ncbi:protein DENND6B isoform X2 [Stegostoma tigrinum]|uniref:protein DENND6B isoform X2 n=1 Tax=Stegostoma tigrinum TaxID=3053191 RepID=UPI0028707BEC|nr:protein DENND6B isoform X2 [Stegostoma tigrinum]
MELAEAGGRARTVKRFTVSGPNSGPALPWDRFSAWLECICVVTFDLELGQAIELVYPHDVRLTEKEKTSICYLSFPDSYSGCLGDTQFSFRIRQTMGHKLSMNGDEEMYNRDAPVVLQRDRAHYYGFVYFRQVKDCTVKRGYFQKSLVLISRLPFVNLFHSLLQLIAPEYFEKLEPCLEAVCNEVDQWPSPLPGKTLSLPIMGVVIQVRIPSKKDKLGMSPLKQSNQENLLPAPLVIPTVHELDLFGCFQSILIHIQMLWELTLLGEPVIIMAVSPKISSDLVLALTSCIEPLRYCCDYRPYFTIHDAEFKEYTTRTQAPPNVILGVTNPFFIKTFQHWPHIIRIGDVKMSGDLPKQIKVKKLMKLRTLDTKPGIYTSYKTFLHKDKALIKRLLKGIQRKRSPEVQSVIVRRHFLELTQSFIIPLNPPQIHPFIKEEFMKTLEYAGPQLTSVQKGDWVGLYRRFFKSPNFDGWFRMRYQEMCKKLEILHLEVLCEADLLMWVQEKSEVEVVDLVLKLREKLIKARVHQLSLRADLLEKLELYLETVICSLPDDLQVMLQQH